jgi:hypothetical protein
LSSCLFRAVDRSRVDRPTVSFGRIWLHETGSPVAGGQFAPALDLNRPAAVTFPASRENRHGRRVPPESVAAGPAQATLLGTASPEARRRSRRENMPFVPLPGRRVRNREWILDADSGLSRSRDRYQAFWGRSLPCGPVPGSNHEFKWIPGEFAVAVRVSTRRRSRLGFLARMRIDEALGGRVFPSPFRAGRVGPVSASTRGTWTRFRREGILETLVTGAR